MNKIANTPNVNKVAATQKDEQEGHTFCDVHQGNGQVVKHSLALRRVNGQWVPTTCCIKCRAELIRAAKTEGKFLPFYGLEQSKAEAAKRNEESLKYKPFLAKFGRTAQTKKESPKPEKVKVISTPAK